MGRGPMQSAFGGPPQRVASGPWSLSRSVASHLFRGEGRHGPGSLGRRALPSCGADPSLPRQLSDSLASAALATNSPALAPPINKSTQLTPTNPPRGLSSAATWRPRIGMHVARTPSPGAPLRTSPAGDATDRLVIHCRSKGPIEPDGRSLWQSGLQVPGGTLNFEFWTVATPVCYLTVVAVLSIRLSLRRHKKRAG
jgi:hypothetical protein